MPKAIKKVVVKPGAILSSTFGELRVESDTRGGGWKCTVMENGKVLTFSTEFLRNECQVVKEKLPTSSECDPDPPTEESDLDGDEREDVDELLDDGDDSPVAGKDDPEVELVEVEDGETGAISVVEAADVDGDPELSRAYAAIMGQEETEDE